MTTFAASGLSGDLQSAAASVHRGVLRGSGTAYAAESPILSQVLSQPRMDEGRGSPMVKSAAAAASHSLSELKKMSVKHLQEMLAERGVKCNSLDKDTWKSE